MASPAGLRGAWAVSGRQGRKSDAQTLRRTGEHQSAYRNCPCQNVRGRGKAASGDTHILSNQPERGRSRCPPDCLLPSPGKQGPWRHFGTLAACLSTWLTMPGPPPEPGSVPRQREACAGGPHGGRGGSGTCSSLAAPAVQPPPRFSGVSGASPSVPRVPWQQLLVLTNETSWQLRWAHLAPAASLHLPPYPERPRKVPAGRVQTEAVVWGNPGAR